MESKILVVTDGLDPLTLPALEYLVRKYNIPPHVVKRIQLDSQVGAPQLVTVTLMVEEEEIQ